MKTKNTYFYPLEKKIAESVTRTSKSPAHMKYRSKVNGATYDLTHAVDFFCAIGTPVRAALGGEVVRVVDGLKKNYDKFKPPTKKQMPEDEQDGNFVVIKHANGEFSNYSHLQNGRIHVKVGQKVRAGKMIGYCGNTGWSILPHLHFMVFRFLKPWPARDFESLEVRWK
jgi:murein DD-endopeptidase MepM/ murein hydrolase activator NlpD